MISEPPADCASCPRLAAFRAENDEKFPDWHNRPVPSFGSPDAECLIVGLAPGLRGANRTGRPFTGDFAGDLLYPSLIDHGFASGQFAARPDDGLSLHGCRITNAVRCVPPANKPTGQEIRQCRHFLVEEVESMPRLRAILALGRIAHQSVVAALAARQAQFPFGHGAVHPVDQRVTLFDSYHCSRYNTNTGRLTAAMFGAVLADIRRFLDKK